MMSLTSGIGTNRTNRASLMMSVVRGKTGSGWQAAKLTRLTLNRHGGVPYAATSSVRRGKEGPITGRAIPVPLRRDDVD